MQESHKGAVGRAEGRQEVALVVPADPQVPPPVASEEPAADGRRSVARGVPVGGAWGSKNAPVAPEASRKPKAQVGATRLRQVVTVSPRHIQAVQVGCLIKGNHLVLERPVQTSRRKVLLHIAAVEFSHNIPRSHYLTNIGDVSVHLTKGYVAGTATANNGPLHVVAEEVEPGAVLTMEVNTRGKPDYAVKTGHQAEEVIDEDSVRAPSDGIVRQWPPVPFYVLQRGLFTSRDLQTVLHDLSSADELPSGTVQPDHRGAAAKVRRGPPRPMK